jgi:hypothetical protein
MSRLTNKPVLDGDPINAASLNTRFSNFTQTDLNEFNVRDAAIDLPQFTAAKFMAPRLASRQIGNYVFDHATYNTVAGQLTGAAPHVISDSGGTPTQLATGGIAGWTISPDELLRVYWDLSVRPRWDSETPLIGSDLEWTFPHPTGVGVERISNGTVCWAFWLQVDVTSSALTNWVNVAQQGSFNTVITAGRGGNLLSSCAATSILPAFNQVASNPNNGKFDTRMSAVDIGWTSVDGAWHFRPGSPTTVYGIRVVCTGPLGAYHAASNWLIRTEDAVVAAADLDYNGGGLQALVMRMA